MSEVGNRYVADEANNLGSKVTVVIVAVVIVMVGVTITQCSFKNEKPSIQQVKIISQQQAELLENTNVSFNM